MRFRLPLMVFATCCVAAAPAMHRYAVSEPTPQRVEVMAKRFGFQPSEATIKKGEPVVLVLKSEDVQHGLRFRELNVDLKIPKDGGETQVEFTPELTGDFVGHCSVFCGAGHGNMTFVLHVVP